MNPLPPTPAPTDPQHLLAQTGWVRALARRLCADDDGAEDLAQDALTLALDRGPVRGQPEPVLRAWLASTLRWLAVQGPRGERRRRGRERLATAAREPLDHDPATVVARAEQHETVVRSVLALDEPYRRTVLARFFDGDSHAEVAAREGVSEAAIRQRVSRGLRELRGRLETEHGGRDRMRRALAVLLPAGALPEFTAPTAATATTAAPWWPLLSILMTKRLLMTLATLALLALVPLFAWPSDPSPPPLSTTTTGTARSAPAAGTVASDEAAVGRRDASTAEASPGAAGAAPALADPRLGRLVVQTVRVDAPAVRERGVLIQVAAQTLLDQAVP